jgi:hypothetical protein
MKTMNSKFEIFETQGERKRLLQGYSRYGYTPQTALADILDNSLSAGASLIKIDISEQVDGSNKVFIADNGKGMSRDRLKAALAFGSPAEIQNSRLSKFGFGMKTASLEVSPTGFSIVTRSSETGETSAVSLLDEDQIGSGAPNGRLWKEEEISQTWLNRLNEVAGENGSGTLIIWEDADLKKADKYKNDVGSVEQTRNRIENRISQYLSMVFHRWLEGNSSSGQRIQIKFQDEFLEPWNPLSEKYLDTNEVSPIPPFEIEGDSGKSVVVTLQPWVIRKDIPRTEAESQARKGNRNQGIYLYRMDRIINNPQWFDIRPNKRDPLNGLRFALNISPDLDDLLHLDVKKSHAELPDEFLSLIRPWVEKYIKSEEDRANTGQKSANKSKTPLDALAKTATQYRELDRKAPTVRPERQSPTEVLTTNQDGVVLPLHMRELPSAYNSQSTVHLVEEHETKGFLWEPRTARDLSLQILINQDHDFYQKVVLPSGPEAYAGFVWLLLAFSRAELATQYSEFKLQFNHMRRHMSETLEEYASEIELPDLSDVENE